MKKSNIGPSVRLEWEESIEFVPVYPHCEVPTYFHTVEYLRESKKWRRYHPSVKMLRKGRESHYEITYDQYEHPEFDVADVDWGTTEIIVDESSKDVLVFWKSDSSLDKEGPIPAKLVEQGERTRTNARPTVRNQSQLRNLLLDTDGICAITGESTRAALECAHIVAVSTGGFELDSNAFLLRADLHCLYDSGCFEISPKGEVVRVSSKLSGYYRDLLKGKKLNNEITRRLTESLAQSRAKT